MDGKKIIKSLKDCTEAKSCGLCPHCGECDLLIADALALIEEMSKAYDNLEYTLMGVMLFVDKWLDGKELELDEINRAMTMREKTLQIVESLQIENEDMREYIRTAKTKIICGTVRKIQDKMAMRFGTYTAKDEVKVLDVVRLINQITEDMLEEEYEAILE